MSGARPTLDEIKAYYDGFKSHFPMPPSMAILGCSKLDIDVEKGMAVAEFQATEEMFNPGRRIQGGFLTAMMDDTMGPLIHVMSAGRQLPSSTDLHTQFHRPASPGLLRSEAKIIRLGAQICTASAELFASHGKMIASCIQTAVMMPFDVSK